MSRVVIFVVIVALGGMLDVLLHMAAGDVMPLPREPEGENIGYFLVGASLLVSNIGSEHLIGLSGTAAASASCMIGGRRSVRPAMPMKPMIRRVFQR